MEVEFNRIFQDFFSQLSTYLPKVLSGLLVFVIFIALGKLFYHSVGKRIQRKWRDSIISNFISQTTKWIFYGMGLIIALNILGFGGVANSIVAGAGIGAIVLGFAFKDIGENFLAGIMLAIKRPFEVGDIIEIDGHKGSVRDLDLRLTHLRNAEGKDIYIPNASIVKNTLTNYTKDGYLRISFTVGIAPECSIAKTKELILDYLSNQPLILDQPGPLVMVNELGEFTVDIQVLFWIDLLSNQSSPDQQLGTTTRSTVISEVKELLDQNGIEMPSQVLEHKMYRDQKLRIEKNNT